MGNSLKKNSYYKLSYSDLVDRERELEIELALVRDAMRESASREKGIKVMMKCLVRMGLAYKLSDTPDKTVKELALKYANKLTSEQLKSDLMLIANSKKPASVAYAAVMNLI